MHNHLLLQGFLLLVGLLFSGQVVYLLAKKKINERNTLVWILGCGVILFLSAFPMALDRVAFWLSIDYPPTLLFLFSMLILLLMLLYQSIQISELNEKVKQLVQASAIQEYDLRRKEIAVTASEQGSEESDSFPD